MSSIALQGHNVSIIYFHAREKITYHFSLFGCYPIWNRVVTGKRFHLCYIFIFQINNCFKPTMQFSKQKQSSDVPWACAMEIVLLCLF